MRFDGDLSDTTRRVKPIDVYLRSISFPNGKTLFNMQDIESHKDLYVWSLMNKICVRSADATPSAEYEHPHDM